MNKGVKNPYFTPESGRYVAKRVIIKGIVTCKTHTFCSKNWIVFLTSKETFYMMLSKLWKSNVSKLHSMSVSLI